MKIINRYLFKFIPVLFCVLFMVVLGQAQNAKLQIDNLNKLESKASEVVDVTLDSRVLEMASKFLANKKGTNKSSDEAKLKELLAGVKGIYVKVFEFDKENEYEVSDVEAVRNQLNTPNWTKLVNVKSKRSKENAEVYLMTDSSNIVLGLAIIATNPKQFAVVNIVGTIDLERLSEMEGNFGIPNLELSQETKESNNDKH